MNRAIVPLLLFGLLALPPRARASLARAPIRRALQQVHGDILHCQTRHHLPPGRYQTSFTIDVTGKVVAISIPYAPTDLSAAAESCLAAAFTRMHVETGYRARPERPDARSGGGRRSRVPPDLRHRRRGSVIQIAYPFTLAARP